MSYLMVIIFKWEDILEIHVSDKGLISRIYNDLYNYKQKADNSSFLKWAKDLNRYFTIGNIQMARTCEKMVRLIRHQGNANYPQYVTSRYPPEKRATEGGREERGGGKGDRKEEKLGEG